MAKKTRASTRTAGTGRKNTATAQRKQTTTTKRAKKHVGDVLGISRARVPDEVPRATTDRGGRPKGIEVAGAKRPRLRRAGVVGGVRGRGR